MEDASEAELQRSTIASRPVGHQKTTSNEAIQRLTDYLSEKGAAKEVMEVWESVLQDRGSYSAREEEDHMTHAMMEMRAEMQEMRTATEAMKESMRIMENKLTGLSLDSFQTTTGSSGRTYASVAASTTPAETRRPGQTPTMTGIKPVPPRLNRELVIQTGDASLDKTGAQLIPLVNDSMPTGKAIACRRLQSGDYVVTLDAAETKNHWETNTQWLHVFGAKARIARREFAILAHGIVINQIQTGDQPVAIQKIYDQNPGLKENVEILRVAWTKRTIKKWEQQGQPPNGKGSLLLSIASPKQANYTIDNGLIWGYQIHECEPYSGECQVTQCFKCYKYGHTQKMCKGVNRCGTCSQPGHKEEDCHVREDGSKWKCINCPEGKDNHSCWSKKCPIRQQKKAMAQKAYQERPYRFQDSTSPSPVRTQSPTGSFTFTSNPPQAEEPDRTPTSTQEFLDGVWEEVTSRRRVAGSPVRGASDPKKIRRGAPTLGERLQKAANQTGQEKLRFANNQS
jgi:hypothetical protein